MTLITNGEGGLSVRDKINDFHADMNREAVIEREGFGRHARNLIGALSLWSQDYIGSLGVGNPPLLPAPITASQSGTTVTASTAVFQKLYVGARIVWDSGQEAIITDVNNGPSSWAVITTCTVDRSQTVSSSAATIRAKHIIGITYGDSLGNRISGVLQKLLYRTLGFGGYVFAANNDEVNSGSQIAVVSLAGGAADASNISGAAQYPWGQRWSLPSGGAITFSLQNNLAPNQGVRPLRHGLEASERRHDTAVLVWRRGAGSFSVERKRFWDAGWEAVETVSDAATGSATFNHLTWKHPLGSDWEYRVVGTSGTINVLSMTFRNDTAPGYVHWNMSRGGELISDFDQIPSADLAELCRIQGQPDFRLVLAYDPVGSETGAAFYRAVLNDDRALWQAAAPRTDHVWFTGWQANNNKPQVAAWNIANRQIAIANDDSLIPLEKLFGDFATGGSARGWVGDGIHPSIKAEQIIGQAFLSAVGIADHPTIREGRDVNSRNGDFAFLRVKGRDVSSRIRNVERKGTIERGARWHTGSGGGGTVVGTMGGAIGSHDFTLHLDVTPLATAPDVSLFTAGADGFSIGQNGGLRIFQNNANLQIALRDASGNTITYTWTQWAAIYAGRAGTLTIRSDRDKGRFDLFWDGEPTSGLVGSILGITTTPLEDWIGSGDQIGIPQGSAANRSTDIYGIMFWREALSDSEIASVVEANAPQITAPDVWWDMREGIGRVALDRSGNNRDGLWQASNPNQYSIGAGPTWRHQKRGVLASPWLASLNATTNLVPGDNVIAAYTANRDMLLPATAAIGDVIRVTVNSTSTIRITQNADQQIKSGVSATTVGTGGRITVPDASSVTLRCVIGGAASVWVVESHTGAALVFT